MQHSIYRCPTINMQDQDSLAGHDSPNMLGTDDFIDIFDDITDFEKAIGIDGEVNSHNIQTIGMEHEQTDTLAGYIQDMVNSNSPESTLDETHSPSTSPTQQNLVLPTSRTYWQHSRDHKHQTTSSAPLSTSNETAYVVDDDSRAKTPGHSIGGMEIKNLARVSDLDMARMEQSLAISCNNRVQGQTQQMQRRRQQKMQDLINRRRQRFQQQKRMDDGYIQHQFFRIEEQAQADKKQRATDQALKRQEDIPFAYALGLALSAAVSAAKEIGIPQLDSGNKNTTPRHQDLQHTHQQSATDSVTDTNDLDPEDPDPWNEEMQHYLLIGRIKRLENIQAIREAEATGNEYKPTVYNPTGIQRHEFDPLLSRHGTGLSVIGAALDAVSTNARIRPSGNQGASLVLQDQHDALANAQRLDLQSLTKRQKVSRMLGLTGNSNNDNLLDLCAGSEGVESKDMTTLPSGPSLTTRDKTSKLLVSNLCVDMTESTLNALAAKNLKSLYLNQNNNTAILYFLSIDAAVKFRRMHDRSLIGGQRITVDFIKN